MDTTSVTLLHRIEPEDEARSQFYALLAKLFEGGPDARLLTALGRTESWPESEDNPLASSWNRLILASRAMDEVAAAQEYTELFVGVGKCPVNLHGSHWISGFMMERPLASLRTDLNELGLARLPGTTQLEDQLGALCETMRLLIAGDGQRKPVAIETQRWFFERHIEPWVFLCCDAICECPLANYYLRVAEFARLFMAVERDSLAIG